MSKANSRKPASKITNSRLQEFNAKQQIVELKKERNRKDNRLALLVSGGAVAFALIAQFSYFGFGPGYVAPEPSDTQASDAPSATAEPTEDTTSDLVPNPSLAEGREWTGTLIVNGKPLEITLDGAAAPQAVANFISLSQSGFYDGLSCHRLVTAGIFVLQCGDPNGDGTGGPGYSWGPIENAPADDVYAEGVLAMARRGGDGSSMGSQFFIVYKDSPIPSDGAGGYTVFGKVTQGLANLDDIVSGGVAGGGTDGSPAVATALGAITLK